MLIPIQLTATGSLQLPPDLLAKLHWTDQTPLAITLEHGTLLITTRQALIDIATQGLRQRQRQRFAHLPPTVSLVDELIRDRRRAAQEET